MLRFAVLMLCASAALAQPPAPPVSSLDWMSGHWIHEDARQKVMEAWVGPGNGMMVGANLTARADGRRSFEHMRIVDAPTGPSFLASPGGRPPVEFRFREAGDQKIVFEKADHDYPQRVLYWRDGDTLRARVEGKVRGQQRAEEWRFMPVRPASAAHSGG